MSERAHRATFIEGFIFDSQWSQRLSCYGGIPQGTKMTETMCAFNALNIQASDKTIQEAIRKQFDQLELDRYRGSYVPSRSSPALRETLFPLHLSESLVLEFLIS
jgi:hypothetical protein